MNKKGHPPTLVPAHPGNTHAMKSGVFSKSGLLPRVSDIEAAIAERSTREMRDQILRRELASLAALGEAIDAELAAGGVRGRGGAPRSLIALRLRVNQKIRQTLDAYAEEEDALRGARALDGRQADELAPPPEATLPAAIARFHDRLSIDELAPEDVDPEQVLAAVVRSALTAATMADRTRARRLLTKRRNLRATYCVCSATLIARDAYEFRRWVDGARASGLTAEEEDPWLASLVRRLKRGERIEPFVAFRRTIDAIEAVVRAGVDSTLRRVHPPQRRAPTTDATLDPFWDSLLSPDPARGAKERLDAYVTLENAGAFPSCTCNAPEPFLEEEKSDALRAYLLQKLRHRDYRAAMLVAQYPETYAALRDAIDAAVIAETRDAGAEAERTAGAGATS